MMKKAILKSLMILAAVVPTFAWSAAQTGEPTAVFSASFDGDNAATGWGISWGTGNEPPETYITTPFGQGFTVASGDHPWHSHNQGQTFTVAVYADISGCTVVSEKGHLLWAFGTYSAGIGLVKTASDTVQVWQNGSPVSGLTYTSDALTSGYHLFVVGNDTNGSYLAVDRERVEIATALADPNAGFQIGSIYQGPQSSNYSQGYGIIIDEIRGYDTKLSTADCEALADAWSIPVKAVWTWNGTSGTAVGSLKSGETIYSITESYIFDATALDIPANNFTYSFWVCASGTNWDNHAGFSNSSGLIRIQRPNSSDRLKLYPDTNFTEANLDAVFQTEETDDLELVTVVSNAGTVLVYVNGVLTGSRTVASTGWASLLSASTDTISYFGVSCAPTIAGATTDDNNKSSVQKFADVKVYPAAFSAAQVKALYDDYVTRAELAGLLFTSSDRVNLEITNGSSIVVELSMIEANSGKAVLYVTGETEATELEWKARYYETYANITDVTFDATTKAYTVTFDAISVSDLATGVALTRPTWLDDSVALPTTMRKIADTQTADLAIAHTDSSLQFLANKRPTLVTTLSGGAIASNNNTANIYGGEDYATGGTVERDLIMHISAGTYTSIFGGSNSNAWSGSTAHNIDGDILVDMAGGTVDYLFGGNWKDGFSPRLQSNIDVVVRDGAVVRGSIFGGGISAHNTTSFFGSEADPVNLNVTVKSLQNSNEAETLLLACGAGYIGGAGVYASNAIAEAQKVWGNSSVTIDLPEDASGEFVKKIIGGSTIPTGGNSRGNPMITITDDTSVTISAPDTVTFTQPIMGGSFFEGTGSNTSTIGGDASLTINGGTYTTEAVYAAGYGKVAVSGDATLTLNGGIFGSETVGTYLMIAGGDATVAGTTTLNLGAATFASPMTFIDAFDVVNIIGNVNLGAYRFAADRIVNIATDKAITISVTATEEEIADETLTVATVSNGIADLSDITVNVTLPDDAVEPDWDLMIKGGQLMLSTVSAKTVEWQKPASGSDWEDGLSGFINGDSVIFGETTEENVVTVPAETIAGDVTISGDYYFNGADLHANDVTVEADAQLTLAAEEVTAKYIRLTPSNVNGGTGSNAVPGIAELILKKNGETVAWPLGTTIRQVNTDGTITDPDWSIDGNESVNALIDTVYSGSASGQTYTNPETNSTGSYDKAIANNKWWPHQNPNSSAVITLGSTIDFDGYQLVATDHAPRSPKNWILEFSTDGTNWIVIDTQTDHAVPAANAFYVYNSATSNTIFPVKLLVKTNLVAANVTIAGTVTATNSITANTITFEAGSEIAVSPENNGPLVLDGEIKIVDTVEITVPTALQELARIPFLETDDESLVEKFTCDAALSITYNNGIYYIGSSSKDVVAELTTATASWDTITWKNSNGVEIATPDFSVGDYSVTLKPMADVTLTVPTALSLITLTVDGTHTVELTGAKITAENLIVTAGTLKAGEATLQLVSPTIAEGATLDYAFTTENTTTTLPSTIGAGTFVKRGPEMVILTAANTYETKLVSAEGVLKLNAANHTKQYTIEIQDGATLTTDYSGIISSETSSILLKGGASFVIQCGNITHGSVLNAAIIIDATLENPARILGSSYGNNVNLAGSISGKGAVEFGNDPNGTSNGFTVGGVIADGLGGTLKVVATMPRADGVTFSGTNTYTGGTEIRNGGNLRVYQMANLGTGPVEIADTGKIIFYNTGNVNTGHDADWNRLTGTGTVAFTASGNFYRTFPVKAKAFTTDLGVENNLTSGLILPEQGAAYQIGSFTGTGAFRVDFNSGTARTLEIIQSKNTTYSGGMLTNNYPDRLGSIFLSGADDATEKTLTYSGMTTVAKSLTIKGTGSLNLTGSWTGAVTVQAGGRLGGSGSIGGGLTLEADAVLDLTDFENILTISGSVALPETIDVILPEMLASDVKILSIAAEAVAAAETQAQIYVEGALVQTADVEVRADGVYLCLSQIYVREFTGTDANWVEANAWTVNGTAIAEPLELASVQLTMTADTTVQSVKPIHLTAMNLLESGTLTLDFNLADLITDDHYLLAPYTIELLRVTDGFDVNRVNVWTSGLKYGAMASIKKTATSVTATITLPDELYITESISINFSDGGTHALTGTAPVGLEGYEVEANNWSQFGDATVENRDVTYVKADGSTETLSGALTYRSANTYRDESAVPVILRGYLDDGGNTASINLTIPESWDEYIAIIYTMTDTDNRQFRAKQVNETYYSYADGKLVVDSDADWGSSMALEALVEGQNTMVIPNLSGNLTINGLNNTGARGCIAAIQVINRKIDFANAPEICTAKVTGECTWDTLTWEPHAPTASEIAELVLTGDATLDITNQMGSQISVVGRNHDLTLIGTDNPEMKWLFSTDTTLAMKSADSVIPSNVKLYPGVIRYDYLYANNFTTLPDATIEFAAGFTGAVTANGGTVIFSDGTITLTQLNTSGTDTEFIFSGTSRTAATKELCFGQATVRVCDEAFVASPKFTLAEGADGYTTYFSIEDYATVNITGATNVHTGASTNSCSVKVAHWPGNATLALSGNGRFVAENADMVLAHNGNATVTIADNAEVRVKGLVHHDPFTATSTVTLNGGKLLIGETGIRTFGSADRLTLSMNGGTLGALTGTVELGADAEAAIANVTASNLNAIKFASEPGATLYISAANSSFLQSPYLTNISGGLRLGDVTLDTLTLDGGILEVIGALTVSTLPVADGAAIAFDGGVLITDTLTFDGTATLTYPIREQLSAGGYIVLNNNTAIPDLSDVLISLVLDSNRGDSEKLMPEYPLIVGAYAVGATPTVSGVSLSNNTNNAIAAHELAFTSGDLGSGLYVKLVGNDILALNTVKLTAASDYTLRQTTADAYPYFYFTSADAGAKVLIPASGVALSHITFTGESTTIKATSSEPSLLLRCNHISFATDMTFDLSAWKTAMDDLIRGAVADVPASVCLISSGITVAPEVTLTPVFGDYTLPEGFEVSIETTADGVYLVVEAERAARTVSVNFTHVGTPLISPPGKPGAYPIPVDGWNDLHTVFSSTELLETGLSGSATTVARNAADAATQLLVYNSRIVTSETAPTSMLKAWLNDSADQEIQIQNIPFDAYRLALIFSNDLEGAAYAPVTIGDNVYCMDAAGYLRKNIKTYAIVNKSNGLTTLEILGDSKWGSTNHTAATAPFDLGQNILVTDVLTDSALTISLPASVYDVTYSGLAAIQVIEAPVAEAIVGTNYAYTFNTADTYNLKDLALQVNDGTETGTWVSSLKNTLTLTSNAEVTVILPDGFCADWITLSGSGKVTLQVENDGGALVNKIDASALKDLTVHFPCLDVIYVPATGVSTFESAFNNNGETYTIATNATLVLGEKSGITTQLDSVTTPLLMLAESSTGTLRRNYPVRDSNNFVNTWQNITLAFKDGIRSSNPNNGGSHLLVEDGDTLRYTGRLHLQRSEDWYYTQTGGNASFENAMATEGGMLLFNNNSEAGKTAHLDISGGRLFATMISAWKTNSRTNITVSDEGTLALGAAGLRSQSDGTQVSATFTDFGTLELVDAQLNATNASRVLVSFDGGRITTTQIEASLNFPVVFNATAQATELAPSLGSTLILNAANTGSGVVEVTQGKVAIANVGALASTTTFVKAGATFESRGHAATTTMANTVIFEDGSTLSATAAEGVKTVRVAGTVRVNGTVTYMLNGVRYSDSGVMIADGVVTFNTVATTDAVTWKSSITSGTWVEGDGTSWEEDTPYYNGADVTFSEPDGTETVEVMVDGYIAPKSVNWDSGSGDSYRFVQASEGTFVDRSGTQVNMGAGQEWLVPVATAHNVDLIGVSNTYRLIGALSNGYKTASLISPDRDQRINGAPAQHAQWCSDATSGATLAPQPGETQIVSAMANTLPGSRSHMTGASDVIITGGGTVQFGGKVGVGGDNTPCQNKGFSGTIIVQDNSTLDFTMVREGDRPNYSFFALPEGLDGAAQTTELTYGAPRYRGDGMIALSILNGGTVRFSGCRNVYGGWANRGDELLLTSRPIEVGANGTIDYAYGTTKEEQQNILHGFSLIGDGATLLASKNIWVSGGSTIKVSGIGEKGDPTQTNVDTDGNLTAGITAEIAGGETTGLISWPAPVTASEPLYLDVGPESTLDLSALLTVGPGDSFSTFKLAKTGPGRLLFTRPLQDMEVILGVEDGSLGGNTTFSNERTEVVMANGTTLEAGLSIPRLTLEPNVELKVNPTGKQIVYGDFITFTEAATYTVSSLLAADEFPNAAGLLPIKVMGWNTARNASAVIFKTDESLLDKGYALEVRKDGLYLKRNVVYVRELDFAVDVDNSPETVRVPWYAENAWYLQDDPNQTPCDYNPSANDAATALFIMPEEYATYELTMPQITLRLSKAVNFSTIRFAVRIEETVDGKVVETLRTVPVAVVYQYYLHNETMPGENEAKSFTWVPTLAVEREGATWTASVEADVPEGYSYAMSDAATVVIYASAANPAINVNFTGLSEGDGAWVSADNAPCGIVPFAGVYWTNASTLPGEGNERLLDGEKHTYFYISNAPVAGVEATEAGKRVTTEITYAASGVGSVVARRGVGNSVLAADYLRGNREEGTATYRPTAAELTSSGLSESGSDRGWQVKLGSIPFEEYDLYLIFAAESDETVRYPAVRIKVGTNDWHTYSLKNGWASPAHQNDDWSGIGGLVDGSYVDGKNVLHFRFSATKDSALEIAPADNGQANKASAMAVGLAALQIVECTDGAANSRVGTGAWSAASGWSRKIDGAIISGKWEDATAERPRYAQITTVSQLEADMLAQTPYLALNGSNTMTLSGEEGYISTGAIDLRNLESGTTINFRDDVFAQAPNVIMAPDVILTLPEGSETRTNMWRWVYDDATRVGTASTTATVQKTGAADLILGRMMLNKIQVDEGTLWLSTQVDGAYTRHTLATGEGTLGKTGAGELHMDYNMLRTSGAIDNVILRCNQGAVQLNARGGQSLPEGKTIQAEGAGLIRIQQHAQLIPFRNGVMKAIDGGTIRLQNATNMFEAAYRPNAVLDSGRFEVQQGGGWHPHIRHFTSTGNSSLYFDGNGAKSWNSQGFILWSGMLAVDSGNLGLYANTDGVNCLVIRATNYLGSEWEDASYIKAAAGATLYSNLPIQGDEGKLLIRKVGTGTWVQTITIAKGGENNDGSNRTTSNIEIEEGTFRLNLGSDKFTQYPMDTDRTIRVMSGARMDGSAEISENTTIYIEEGATIASGAVDWVGISPACPGYNGMPAKFKQVQTQPLVIQGDLDIASDATLEVDLSNEARLTVSGLTRFGATLTVRLKNLPASLTENIRLTNFTAGQVVGVPEINCPEAIALDADVVFENGNIWLKSSEAAYVWADQAGAWSAAEWTITNTVDQLFPYSVSASPVDEDAPVARVQAAESNGVVEVTVDKGNDSTDGRAWPMQALVLSAEKDQTIDLVEALTTPIADPLPEDIDLNKLWVYSTIWKLGAGEATVRAPIEFYTMGENSSLNVQKGSLTLTHPLITQTTSKSSVTVVPTTIDIQEGASLTYALAASADEKRIINEVYDPLTQTVIGNVTGGGSLIVDAAGSHVTLNSPTDNTLDYFVRAGRLALGGSSSKTDSLDDRTIEVAAGATLDLTTGAALGWTSEVNWTLTSGITSNQAGDVPGALVATSGYARVRGNVTVVKPKDVEGATSATFGQTTASIDGDLTLTVPETVTLNVNGIWQTPSDCTSGMITKLGAGEMVLSGSFESNLPMTISEGVVCLNGSVNMLNNNFSATIPDWVVESGAALVTTNGGRINLGDGSLTVESGATLDIMAVQPNFMDPVTFEDGATLRAGSDSGQLGAATFADKVTVNGVVMVNLDRLDPELLLAAGTASYKILDFGTIKRGGLGIFLLGGEKAGKWAEAGWSLTETASTLVLEAFGGVDGSYTWAGAETADGNWGGAYWRAPTPDSEDELINWESVMNEAEFPSVTLQDVDPLNDQELIPTTERTLIWSDDLGTCTLTGLRCSNSEGDYTLTASGTKFSELNISGILLKTGTSKLTIDRPTQIGTSGAVNLLGGEMHLRDSLISDGSGALNQMLTIGGEAILRVSATNNFTGFLDGDTTGTIIKDTTGVLSLGSALDTLKAVKVEAGKVNLTADDQYAVLPEITVEAGASLEYSPTLAEGKAVTMVVNATEGAAPEGSFVWSAAASRNTVSAPRLAAPADLTVDVPAINVTELEYAPNSGHLVIDPGHDVLPETATLYLEADVEEQDALWVGSKTEAGTDFSYAALYGTGLVSVEPTIDLLSDMTWATQRAVTLNLDPAAEVSTRTFNGKFSGGFTLENTKITLGLNVTNANAEAGEACFILANHSTATTLGTLSAGEKTRVEVTGAWAGDVTVSEGATLAGGQVILDETGATDKSVAIDEGIVAASGRTVTVPAGATLSASVNGKRPLEGGAYESEIVPTVLTVDGSLSLVTGSKLKVLARTDLAGKPWISTVEVNNLSLPLTLEDGAKEVVIDVILDIEDGAVATGQKILGWNSISGVENITGRVFLSDGTESEDYIIRQKEDGLYIQHSSARFWMILR